MVRSLEQQTDEVAAHGRDLHREVVLAVVRRERHAQAHARSKSDMGTCRLSPRPAHGEVGGLARDPGAVRHVQRRLHALGHARRDAHLPPLPATAAAAPSITRLNSDHNTFIATVAGLVVLSRTPAA